MNSKLHRTHVAKPVAKPVVKQVATNTLAKAKPVPKTKPNPNPQGKGMVPLMDCLAEARTCVPVPAKSLAQISSELFTSMFVLHSEFSFKPVVGNSYYLYAHGNGFVLSLIAPQEWGGAYGRFVGTCVLQNDITWTLTMDESALSDAHLMAIIANKRKQFERALEDSRDVESFFPEYLQSLPFYQRVLAWALSGSLRTSLYKSGYKGLSYGKIKALSGGMETEPGSAKDTDAG